MLSRHRQVFDNERSPFDDASVPAQPLFGSGSSHRHDTAGGPARSRRWLLAAVGGTALAVTLLTYLLPQAIAADTNASAHDSAPPAAPTDAVAIAAAEGLFRPSTNLSAALAQAKRDGKAGVVVLYEMNGCGDCKKLRATTLQDPALQALYDANFVTVSVMADEPTPIVDFDGEATTQMQLAGVQRVFALPTVVFHDLDGLPVARQMGSALPLADWLRLAEYVKAEGYEDLPFSAWQPGQETPSDAAR